jgi:hypothetical protein
VAWPQVLELLAVNRLIDPGSEFRLHRQWFDQSATDVLLGQDFAVAEKDRLYRCLDRVLDDPPSFVWQILPAVVTDPVTIPKPVHWQLNVRRRLKDGPRHAHLQ